MITIPYLEFSDYPQYYFGKVCAIIPCKDRAEHLRVSLRHWLQQTFRRLEIIVVDYSSEDSCLWAVQEVSREYGQSVDFNPTDITQRYTNYSRLCYMRLDDLPVWNMSHALNYAITRSTSDVITVAGCDSLPEPRYVDTIMHLVSDKVVPSVICGRMTYPRKLWYQINGYQEFCTGWGHEDVDFRHRLRCTGAHTFEINTNLCPSIGHQSGRKLNPEANKVRCDEYYYHYGYIANYCLPCGNLKPIQVEQPQNQLCIYSTQTTTPPEIICNPVAYAGCFNSTAFYALPIEGDQANRFSFNCTSIRKITTTAPIWSFFHFAKDEQQINEIFTNPEKIKEMENEPVNLDLQNARSEQKPWYDE